MEEKGRVCATDRVGYSIILGIMVLFLGLSVWVGFADSVRHGVTGGVAVLFGMAWCVWKLIDLRYLDGEGILLDDSKENRAYIEEIWGKIAE